MNHVWVCDKKDCGWYEFDNRDKKYYRCPECGRFMKKYNEGERTYQELLIGAQLEADHRLAESNGDW